MEMGASVSDVESAVKRLYRNSDVVLSADDYAGIEIVVELPPISSADVILDLRLKKVSSQ